MSVAQQQPAPTSQPGSDRAVVEAVRAGEISQFALLYQRYSGEALRIARRQVGADEAQDLVQETFAKVLRAIQNGGGPTEDVAGYIFRTLRNLRIDRGGQREFATDDVESAGPAGLWVVPDTSDDVLDRSLVSDAFAELPPRWREVLWLTEVEGVGPGELSDRMGIKATAVSTLSLRARAGFRSAWLQAHVRAGAAPRECRPVVAKLGDYQTGRLSTRRRAQVAAHLDECEHCPAVVAELTAVSSHLGALLLPVVVLAPKALWWVFGGWGVKAGFLLWGAKATVNRLRDPKVAVSSVGGAATVAVVTAVAMAVATPPEPPPAADPAPSASSPATSSSGQGSSSSSSSSSDDQAEPSDTDEPADQPESADSPASVPPATPVDPGPDQAAPEPPQQDSPSPADEPADEPTQASEPDDPAPESEDPAPEPEEPADEPADPAPEPEEPETTAPDAPVVTDAPTGPTTVYGDRLELTGADAVPGAVITATDADGDPVAEGQVDDDGNWTLEIGNPGSEGESGGGMPGLASGGTASRSVAARGLADVAAERGLEDDDRGDGGDDGEGDDGAGDGGAEEGEGSTDGAYYFTLTQTVREGASGEYAGESEPVTMGPFSWVAPLAVLSPEDGGEAEITPSGGRWADYIWVEYQHDCRFDVQFFLNGSPVELHDLVPIDVCDPTSGLLTGRDHLHRVTSRSYELAMQYVDDDGELVGDRATVCFAAVAPGNAGEDDGGGDDSGDDRDCPEPDSAPTSS